MNDELTYILGAGASFESMPLVKSFPRRFMFFVYSMKILVNHKDVSSEDQTNVNKLYSHALEFHKEIASHQSFDTFFKKLYHTEQDKTIRLYKKVLNIYFLWEHITNQKGNSDETYSNLTFDTDFEKISRIDRRYDALIAGLLMPVRGIPQPYCKINFITWNYDLNLLMSLKNYYSPNSKIGDFLQRIDKKGGVWKLENQFTIINMNGYFYRSELNDLITLENVRINEMIFDIIKGNYFEDSFVDEDANLIKFAWESESTIVTMTKSLIDASDNIVVIGYTFPLYNRMVDLGYFNNLINSKRLYIQDPNSEQMIENYKVDFALKDLSSSGLIKSIKECNSFFVPSNIYKK